MALKKVNVIILLPFFFSCSSGTPSKIISNPEIAFVKTFGGTKNESANTIIKTNDGGYLVAGFTQSSDGDITNKLNDSFDFLLLKFDANNNLQWQNTFGGSDDDRASDVVESSDGGFVVLGASKSIDGDVSENNGQQDYWLTKIDAFGNLLWQKTYGFSGADSGTSLIATNDGGYLLTGILDVTASGGAGNSRATNSKHAGGDYWVIKVNNLGELQWSKYFGGTFTDTPFNLIETDINEYIIVGSSDSQDVDITNPKGQYDFWVIKISNTGNLIWEKSFGGDQNEEAKGITKTNDGNYLIIGDTRSNNKDVTNNKGAADLWLIKISPLGDLIWEKTIGGTSFDSGTSISNTLDNGFILCGNSRSSDMDVSSNYGQNDAWIIKINVEGILEWQKSIGGSNFDFAHDVIQLNNETIICVGETSSSDFDIPENKGFTDLLIININE